MTAITLEPTFISLFAGIEAPRLGLERAGWKCVWENEIDPHKIKVIKKQFGDKELDSRDIRTIPTSDIPSSTLLVGGFPCQSFSIAGKRGSFADTRGTLFQEIVRIARDKRPRVLLLENVPGLLSAPARIGTGFFESTEGTRKGELTSDMRVIQESPERGWKEITLAVGKGYCFTEIILQLQEIGYSLEWEVLNSKFYGVPQSRPRVFLVGHLGNKCARKVFPIRGNAEKSSKIGQVAGTLTGGGHSGGLHSNMTAIWALPRNKNRKCLFEPNEILPALRTCQRPPNPNIISKSVRSGDRGSLDRHSWDVIQVGELNEGSQAGRVYSPEGISPTLHKTGGCTEPVIATARRIRRLMEVECERLQGFPDGWTEGLSATQRYKALGDAMTVNVLEHLGRVLKQYLEDD